ncbi:MAG: hypothetical protein K9N06_06705 [Candidatus Cloacimonetes bacterium]|nr:hypothetical protein [Candidatus Cloacimonadota bacterium]
MFLCLISNLPAVETAGTNPVRFYLFYSEDCEDCEEFLEYTLPYLEQKYSIDYQLFSVNDSKNFALLNQLEKQYGATKDVPIIFIGDYIIGGLDAHIDIENIIIEYSKSGCEFPEVVNNSAEIDSVKSNSSGQPQQLETENGTESITNISDPAASVYIAYFFKEGCSHCDRTYLDLQHIKKKYPQVVIREYDISTRAGMELSEALSTLYDLPENKHSVTPVVFIGDKYLLQEKARWHNLENIILLGTSDLEIPPWEKAEQFKGNSGLSIIERFKSLGIITIILAGLIDGINPCAFATIIFLVSYLSLSGRKGKEILIIGFSYTLAVFLTYFLLGILGLSILEKIRQINSLAIIINILFVVIGTLSIILAAYSLYDYYLFRKSRTSEMVLQLPRKIKLKIHQIIREKTKVQHFIIGAFVIGFLVSIQELFCTGQVYLPTLVYMSNLMQYRLQAYIYLIIYNILFIFPLIVVFMLIYWGISSRKMGNWVQQKTGITKILLAVIFLILGIILIYSGIRG